MDASLDSAPYTQVKLTDSTVMGDIITVHLEEALAEHPLEGD